MSFVIIHCHNVSGPCPARRVADFLCRLTLPSAVRSIHPSIHSLIVSLLRAAEGYGGRCCMSRKFITGDFAATCRVGMRFDSGCAEIGIQITLKVCSGPCRQGRFKRRIIFLLRIYESSVGPRISFPDDSLRSGIIHSSAITPPLPNATRLRIPICGSRQKHIPESRRQQGNRPGVRE